MPDDSDKPRRSKTQTERDEESFQARREREAKHAIPLTYEDEDLTGRHERGEIDAEELAHKRSRRPTPDRLLKLEADRDEFRKDVGTLKTDVAGIKGEMKVWPDLVEKLSQSVDRALNREDAEFTATLDVHKRKKLSAIEGDQAARLARIDVYKALALKIIGGSAIVTLAGAIGAAIMAKCGG